VRIQNLDKISKPVDDGQRTYRGFNLFHGEDQDLFEAIVRGEFTIRGFQNRLLRLVLVDKSGSQISPMLKRLRMHGLIKKVHGTYKYYLTRLGRKVVSTALKLKTMFIIPSLAEPVKMTA
jgi:hypothetical protein